MGKTHEAAKVIQIKPPEPQYEGLTLKDRLYDLSIIAAFATILIVGYIWIIIS